MIYELLVGGIEGRSKLEKGESMDWAENCIDAKADEDGGKDAAADDEL